MSNSKLFTPLKVGQTELEHRVVMAPLTRYRCDDDWVPLLPMVRDYYAQRACVPGTLIISEATAISPRHAGKPNSPGIWSRAQILAWQTITAAVHARSSRIWCQLWALGRAAEPSIPESCGSKLMSASAIPLSAEGSQVPVEMSERDIREAIEDYVSAARNAVEAGFDGVEIHGANGYLPDQFLQSNSNERVDGWGGSVEKRCRFHLEVSRAVVATVGAGRTAIRLSPWSDFLDMLMPDPVPTFTHLVGELKKLELGYLSLVEARVRGNDDTDVAADKDVGWLVRLWDNTSPVFIAGGFNSETAAEAVDVTYRDYDVAIVFGRYFVSNPDLVYRLRERLVMEKYDRTVFYTPKLPEGYIDYPMSSGFVARSIGA